MFSTPSQSNEDEAPDWLHGAMAVFEIQCDLCSKLLTHDDAGGGLQNRVSTIIEKDLSAYSKTSSLPESVTLFLLFRPGFLGSSAMDRRCQKNNSALRSRPQGMRNHSLPIFALVLDDSIINIHRIFFTHSSIVSFVPECRIVPAATK